MPLTAFAGIITKVMLQGFVFFGKSLSARNLLSWKSARFPLDAVLQCVAVAKKISRTLRKSHTAFVLELALP